MRVICDRGFYRFYPSVPADLFFCQKELGLVLTRRGDFYTFPVLAALETYSIKGQPYGGVEAAVTYCSSCADVMEANGLVYGLAAGRLVPADGIIGAVSLYADNTGYEFLTLPQAGAYAGERKIKSFAGMFFGDNTRLVTEEVQFYESN